VNRKVGGVLRRCTFPSPFQLGNRLAASYFLLALLPLCEVSRAQDTLRAHANPATESPAEAPTTNDAATLAAIEDAIRSQRYADVEDPLRRYVRDHPQSSRAHYDLGYLLFSRHDGARSLKDSIRESIEQLSRSLALNLEDPDAHKILGLDFTMIQREDLAVVEFRQAERLNPNSAEIHYFLGRHFMTLNAYNQARPELERAVTLDPNYIKAYMNLGITFEMLNDDVSALKNYRKAIEMEEQANTSSDLPYVELARFYHDHGQLDLSKDLLSKALQKNARSDRALYELARDERELSHWSAAADALEKAVALNPREPQYYFLLGRTYHEMGRAQESDEAFARYRALHDGASNGTDQLKGDRQP
jgi:tetratricopeptide (TPR) repeat protein